MHPFQLSSAFLMAFVVAAHAAAGPSTPATPSFIDSLIHEAVSSHPSIAAAEARTRAASAAIAGVRLWDDPQLGLGVMAATREMRMDDGDIIVGFDQMLPRPGLYRAEKRRAVAEQNMQQANLHLNATQLGLSVAQAVLELALADELIQLQDEDLAWLATIVKAAEERAKNPDATASESLRLESELAIRNQAPSSLRRQRAQFATTLNLLLGRKPTAAWPALTLDAQPPALASATSLKVRLEKGNPQLEALRNQIDGAQAEADAAREKRKPIVSLGVETNTYSGGDFRSAMVGVKVTLPWFNRSAYAADIARAESLRDATTGDLATQQRQLYTDLTRLMTEVRNNQQLVSAYSQEVLPKSVKAVETLQGAWVSSKATLLEVLDARRSLLEARQQQKRALAAQHVAMQSLAALVGANARTSSSK